VTTDEPEAVPPMAKVVLGNFVDNPQLATDLLQLARWSIPQKALDQDLGQVSRALEWLVTQGFVVRDSRTGVAPMYRLNLNRAGEAKRFLRRVDERMHVIEPRIEVSPLRGPVVAQACKWIDAVLLHYHLRHPHHAEDRPGLSRSQSSIERLLTLEAPNTGAVRDAERKALAAARDLDAALRDPAASEPIARMCRLLRLEPFEAQAVVLCLAPELDARYQTIFGILNDDLGRRRPTLALLCALLGEPLAIRDAFVRASGLTSWRLFEYGAALPFADEALRLDPWVTAWLLGNPAALFDDPVLHPLRRSLPWVGARWMRDVVRVRELAAIMRDEPTDCDWVVLSGQDPDGWRAILEAAAIQADVPLLRISLASVAAAEPAAVDELAIRVARAIQLSGEVPVLDLGILPVPAIPPLLLSRIVSALEGWEGTGLLVVREAERVIRELPRERCRLLRRDAPDRAELTAVYMAAATEAGLYLSGADAGRLALTFPMSLESIDEALRYALLQGAAQELLAGQFHALASACRRIAAPDLPRFARRIAPTFRLDDVVLPTDRRAQLDEMVSHVRHAARVLGEWGFDAQLPYGRGVAALFCGPSGTGKTMAAQAIAHTLNTETYAVDLSRIVSKYIGESEKNLDMVFSDAERAGAVLLFDEADALFGKRSEIKDAHDRYANIEVAYLLQRMEAFAGLAILTTNFRQNLDQAFLRRLRFIVEFPKPDIDAREAIWRQCLPNAAPQGSDINLRFLARRLDLTGGNIRQITLRAAFLAADEPSEKIEMRHVVTAARAELVKLGMSGAERDLATFEATLPAAGTRVA